MLYATKTAGELAPVAGTLGVIGVLLLATGIALRWPLMVPWAVVCAGGAYLIARRAGTSVDGWAAVVGAGLLASAELALWSIGHDTRIVATPGLTLRRAGILGGLVAGALLVDFLLLGSAAVAAPSGVLLAAVGVAAAVASIAVVLRLLRRY